MHHIYHSEAFVIGSRQSGEDSKTIFLYTKELGLIYAKAQGIRKLSSKLRFTLQDFSFAQVDLVRGKEIWRITTAVPIDSNSDIMQSIHSSGVFSRIFSLFLRLVNGEEKNDELFSILKNICDTLRLYGKSEEDCHKIELFYAAQILMSLGYLSRGAFEIASLNGEVVPEVFSDLNYRRNLVKEINNALSLSHL